MSNDILNDCLLYMCVVILVIVDIHRRMDGVMFTKRSKITTILAKHFLKTPLSPWFETFSSTLPHTFSHTLCLAHAHYAYNISRAKVQVLRVANTLSIVSAVEEERKWIVSVFDHLFDLLKWRWDFGLFIIFWQTFHLDFMFAAANTVAACYCISWCTI